MTMIERFLTYTVNTQIPVWLERTKGVIPWRRFCRCV